MKYIKKKMLLPIAIIVSLALSMGIQIGQIFADSLINEDYYFDKNLTFGSYGEDVVRLQLFLEEEGYLNIPSNISKGYFGNLTRQALASYQSANNIIPALGYFGPITRAHIQKHTLTKDIPSDITLFVESFNFPEVQEAEILYKEPEKDLYFFQVSFGEPQDCPAGCFYWGGTALKYGDRIAWIDTIDIKNGFPNSSYPLFDFKSGDNYLFSDEFYNNITSSLKSVRYGALDNLLAKDSDTPDSILESYIQYLLSTNGYVGGLGEALLENPKVQKDKDLLERLIQLPYYYKDTVKKDAQKYFDELD